MQQFYHYLTLDHVVSEYILTFENTFMIIFKLIYVDRKLIYRLFISNYKNI